MIVFSNTTPIIALSSIQRFDLLPELFGHIHLVNEVVDECEVGGVITVPSLFELGGSIEPYYLENQAKHGQIIPCQAFIVRGHTPENALTSGILARNRIVRIIFPILSLIVLKWL